MKKRKHFSWGILATAGLALLAIPTHAATIFETNDTGNAAALDGAIAGTITPLTLSPADGGGTINVTTIGVFNGGSAQSLGMDADSFGVTNDLWGNTNQRWIFEMDQLINFDGIGYTGGGNEGLDIQSEAWKDDANFSGPNWDFFSNGTIGWFEINSPDGPAFDFTSAGVSSVAAGTEITIIHQRGNGGGGVEFFTISPGNVAVPEPASVAVWSLLGLGLAGFRRYRASQRKY